MIIGAEGQFYFNATLGDLEDFITEPDDLKLFALEENTGNVLPMFTMEFISRNTEIIRRLNNSTTLLVQFGPSRDEYDDIPLSISTAVYKDLGTSSRYYTLKGFLDTTEYGQVPKIFISDKKSGVEVIAERVKPYFKFVSNTNKSQDSQNWIQHNISTREFINNTYMHCYSPKSFFATAITYDKKFILKDVKKEASAKGQKPDWVISNYDKGFNVIKHLGNVVVESKQGLINSLIGQGRKRIVYDIISGENESIYKELEPILALTNKVAKKASLEAKFVGSALQNENTHDNFFEAFTQNLLGNISLGAIVIPLDLDKSVFRKIKPLDIISYKSLELESDNSSEEYASGIYIVKKVLTTISGKTFSQSVVICRESFNQVKDVN